MSRGRAYKNLLAATVIAALGTTGAWAADVNTGYTPQTTKSATTTAADAADESAMAAISQARSGIAVAQQSDETAARNARIDDPNLRTSDKDVQMITRVQGTVTTGKEGVNDVVPKDTNAVQAQYYTSVTDEQLKPYIGKTITKITVNGVDMKDNAALLALLNDPANTKMTDAAANTAVEAKFLGLVKEKVGDKLSIAGVDSDIAALGSSGVISEINPVITQVPEGIILNYNITLNPVVNGVNFVGNTIYPTAELVKYMDIKPGTVLNTISVGEKVQGINRAYARDGYMLAHVENISVSDKGILNIYIVEGIVEKIVVAGNKKTKSYVITREMNQKVGQPFNQFLMRRSVEKIYNLGFFDDVNVRLLPGSNQKDVIAEVDVLEHKTGTITLGAGYSHDDGLVGIVELGEDNLRGTGDKVKIHWEFGGKGGYKNFAVSYLRPWIDSKGTSLGVTIFNRQDAYTDYDANGSEVSEYDKKSKGFNVSLGRQTGEFTRDYLTAEVRDDKWAFDSDDMSGFMYNRNKGTGTEGGVNYNNQGYDFLDRGYIKKNFGRTHSLTWQKVYDSRDNVYDPTRGRRISSTFQWAGHGLGGDFNFYKFTGEYRAYKPIGHSQVLAFRGLIGWATGHVPYSMLYTLGGGDNLRGYEDDQFRGKKMYNASVEYRFPIWKKISGVLFADLGDAWDAPDVIWYQSTKQFNASVGPGLRVTTPIGPIRLDYGFGLHNARKFQFSFGGQF
ncbi:MAG: BamA/TamA family outer membrane protein [Veillonellaceae bacterium]|nr:BamA/TamA family outer membrane protein [Veillonellaceae bacterium]